MEKFGDDYKAYMKKVPRANFLLGIIRRFRRSE
jgi:protein-S-isoprenylcysteine O-methyltransferase Ste14